jgi:N-acetylglucosamine repressor
MKIKNFNSAIMKQVNLSNVLDTIRQKETISRKELADCVGLTSSSITNIVDRLIEDGFVKEVGTGESLGGRKPILLELNPSSRYVVGVELNATNILCMCTDFKMNKILKKSCPTHLEEGQEKVIDRLVDLIKDSIDECNIPQNKVLGIGLVSAGPYDHVKGIMINPPNFIGWKDVPIKHILEERTGITTYFEKETVAATIAEIWRGSASKAKSLVGIHVYYIGIGGGIIIDSQIYHGFMDGGGELGHMTIDLNGPECTCGDRGCLEAIASGNAIANDIRGRIAAGETPRLFDPKLGIEQINAEFIYKSINKRDPLVLDAVDKGAMYLGVAISNIINFFSPDMIVIGGDIVDNCKIYYDKAVEYTHKRIYPWYNKKVNIVRSKLGDERCVWGGISIVLQKFYENLAKNN